MSELNISNDETLFLEEPILLDGTDSLTLYPEPIPSPKPIPLPTPEPIPFPHPKPIPITRPVSVTQVTGKEYSNNADKNTLGIADPGQTLLWDGTGATTDGTDYSTLGQVDAMANAGDAFFNQVLEDQAALVFSTTFDNNIYFELPASSFGLTGGIWATPNQIDAPGPGSDPGVQDVDALELWGPDNFSDASYYSVYGDAMIDPLTGQVVSGAVFDQNNNVIFTNQEITKAVNQAAKLKLRAVNLDAMMVSGDEIIFSVDAIEGFLDGGEIFVYDQSTGNSNFLKHGGHLWDTSFDVMGTFGTASENINALEAVGTQEFTLYPKPYPVPPVYEGPGDIVPTLA